MKRNLFYFDKDEGGGASAPAAPADTSATTPGAAAAATPAQAAPAAPATPADPVAAAAAQATGQAAPAATATVASPTWIDQLKQHNIPVGATEEETIANIRRIAEERRQLEQFRPLVPHVNDFVRNAKAFKEWQESQKKQEPKSQDEPYWKKYFNPPEYNRDWISQVVKDENGNLVPAPGASPDVAVKLMEYQRFRNEQMETFMQNPHEYIAPTVKALAEQIANETIEKRLAAEREKQSNTTFIKQNESWLYDIDPATKMPREQIGFDPATGEQRTFKVLSPWGQHFAKYVERISQQQAARGYHDEEEAKNLAMVYFERDVAQAKLGMNSPAAAPGTATPQDKANQAFLDKANPPGKSEPGGGNSKANEKVTNKNLIQAMLKEMREAGISDAQLVS